MRKGLLDADSFLFADGSLRHNKVITRLWLWDAQAVAVGKSIKNSLVAAMELQLARKTLMTEFREQGAGHPLFVAFAMLQLSSNPGGKSLSKEQTEFRWQQLTENEKQHIFDKIIEKLDRPISLCTYQPGTPEIRGLRENEITPFDLFKAMQTFLMHHLASEEIAEVFGDLPLGKL